jgi:uncharacterized protein (TIGR02246 family)
LDSCSFWALRQWVRGRAAAQDQADEQAIRELAATWEQAWNQRDADLLGSILAENVDWVSVAGPDGRGWGETRGRRGFIAAHTQLLDTLFAESHWTNTAMDIRFLRPDVAVTHVVWETTGDNVRHVKHGSPRRGIFTWTLTRESAGWRVAASQNTEVMPPLPGQ